MSVPAAYLAPWTAPGLAVQAVLLLGLMLGILAGRHQILDADVMERGLRRRFRAGLGTMTIDERQSTAGMYRPARPGDRIDAMIRIVFWVYGAVVIVGAPLGGGAGYIILTLLARWVDPGTGPDLHATAMTTLGAVAIPAIGYFMPPIWRMWRLLQRIEAEAEDENGNIELRWK
ncbi:hypothetical protein [Roseinatronobacter monicus]|nr:hypothetical protein [Roseinatronobacter monicus]